MDIVMADVFLNFSRLSNDALTIHYRDLTGDIFFHKYPSNADI